MSRDLREISATADSPYRCFVRGTAKTEGADVHTIGFKDGLAVVQQLPAVKPPVQNSIDLSRLKQAVVKVDAQTGKKYIIKDGRRIEILPQLSAGASFSFKNSPVLRIKSIQPAPPRETATMTEPRGVDKWAQAGGGATQDKGVQTEDQGDPPIIGDLCQFLLNDQDLGLGWQQRHFVDPAKLQTKEDIKRFTFFNDMRNALNFDRSGNLPIHESVMQNNLKLVQKHCVVLKAIRENVNILNQQNFAPLHLAIVHDVQAEIIQTLLKQGADVLVGDSEGNTPLHLAVENRNHAHLRLLVSTAAQNRLNLDQFNHAGFTPLILACLNEAVDDVTLLLQHGADPNVKDMKSGRTSLFHALEVFNVTLVDLLLQYKADTKSRNFFGTSAHDAMFEIDEMPLSIKLSILGRDHSRMQPKKRPIVERKPPIEPPAVKKPKLQTTAILRKLTEKDFVRRPTKKF